MLRQDTPSVAAIIMIVVDVPVLRRIFGRIGVVWCDLRHLFIPN
jgi:hypothetical protein